MVKQPSKEDLEKAAGAETQTADPVEVYKGLFDEHWISYAAYTMKVAVSSPK